MVGDLEITENRATTDEQECPQCKATIPLTRGYVTWCDKCGWNVEPLAPDEPKNIFESLYESIGQRLSKAMFDEMAKATTLKSQLTVSQILAVNIALLVHSLTLLLVILAVLLLVYGGVNCALTLYAVFLLAIAWVLRPRIPKLDEHNEPLPRNRFAALYKMTGDIASALGTSNVDAIIVDERFNASFGELGWRRKRVLRIGLPLFSILDPRERVALLGHELAHGADEDPAGGSFVGTAIDSLVGWYTILHPGRLFDPGSLEGIVLLPFNLVRAALAGIVWLWLYALAHLVWREAQRAEYRADYMAAVAGSTEAAISTMNKLHFGKTFYSTLHRVTLNWNNQDLFGEFKSEIERIPSRELERMRRIDQLAGSRLDVTHPPTAYRIEMLRAHPVEQPGVVISPEDLEAVERELESLREDIQHKLLEMYRSAIIY